MTVEWACPAAACISAFNTHKAFYLTIFFEGPSLVFLIWPLYFTSSASFSKSRNLVNAFCSAVHCAHAISQAGWQSLGFHFPRDSVHLDWPQTSVIPAGKAVTLGKRMGIGRKAHGILSGCQWICCMESVFGSRRQALGPGSLGFASCQFYDMEKKVSIPFVPQFSHL